MTLTRRPVSSPRGSRSTDAGSPSDKLAILYRTNAQSRVFEEALRRQRIDYNIVGGFSFYERAEVKDIIAYLKLAMNPFDDIALLRVINTPGPRARQDEPRRGPD